MNSPLKICFVSFRFVSFRFAKYHKPSVIFFPKLTVYYRFFHHRLAFNYHPSYTLFLYTDMIEVAVNIKFDQEFTNDLNDPSSPKYKELEKNITDTVSVETSAFFKTNFWIGVIKLQPPSPVSVKHQNRGWKIISTDDCDCTTISLCDRRAFFFFFFFFF